MDKNLLRKKCLFQRNQLSLKTVSTLSYQIMSKFIQTDLYKNSDELFSYVGIKNEVDTLGMIEKALAEGKRIAVPKTFHKGIMKFYYICSLEELVLGKFDLLEPRNIIEEAKPNQCSIFIVPGIAFDRSKNRLGYGAGFYDRYLQNNQYHKSIALAYESQIVDEIPTHSYDVPMDLIITDKNIYY
ncbi:MAG: 5-formyltetrahydrofolate cyclo-ligase [Firmicutes bacterium HGW-Firmicutes-1]|jgi:5-formyltetrahydrofolate cyclo-ligase|nr:MAG: 5-formyltetrahydrofolate cyclo-ligase [Firmicutes bacterium HGW-Firmicutes-1]